MLGWGVMVLGHGWGIDVQPRTLGEALCAVVGRYPLNSTGTSLNGLVVLTATREPLRNALPNWTRFLVQSRIGGLM